MKKYAKYLSLLLIIPFLASCSSSGKKGNKNVPPAKKHVVTTPKILTAEIF